MFETHEQYKEIVRREVAILQETTQYRICNGEPGSCPRCGREGIWDIATKGFIHHMGNSIYYSTVFNQWRCGICDDPTYRLEAALPPGAIHLRKRDLH